tara:strand:+ start:82 stop:588 length:507 start_codon:yes stop_codon:yes gene_type:complete
MKFPNKTITIIVAASENNAIGKNNDLIWDLPNDLKRFKKLTSGHCIIMGRKTFDSFPGLLPNRKHIIISNKPKESFSERVTAVNNLDDAIKATGDDENPYIIGGGQIYKIAMSYCDKIELTRVHEKFEADTFFPKIDTDKWKLINSEKHEKDERHDFSYTYKTYIKNN